MAKHRAGRRFAPPGPGRGHCFSESEFDLPIETEYHQVAILKNAPDMKGGGCACIDSVSATYFRSDAHDKFLIGDFYGQRGADPDNFPQRASDDGWKKSSSAPAGRSETGERGSHARSHRSL